MFAPPVPKSRSTSSRTLSASSDTRNRIASRTAAPAAKLPDGNATYGTLDIRRTDDPFERDAERAVPTMAAPAGRATAGTAPAVVHDALRSAGQPLDDSTREYFGERFGVDFGSVRLHTDEGARRSAAAVGATGYTVGRHIVLGAAAPSPATAAGRRLLDHELTHVVQQAHHGLMLQRQPSKPATPLPQFVPADLVQEIRRDNETWYLTVGGHTSAESLARAIFRTSINPPGVTITMKVAITDPIERGWFVIEGLTPTALLVAEPSFRKLFEDRGLVEELPASKELKEASDAFYNRHAGSFSSKQLYNMAVALRRATKRNPELLLAYYKYYANHDLDDDSIGDYDSDKHTGATEHGETVINPSVASLTSKFKTSDPISLLGSTMIHEFVHTAHGGMENAVGAALKEAKAYGIELFFAERMGDEKREEVINKKYRNDVMDTGTGGDKIFRNSYWIMKQLYVVIDQGGPAADEARAMSVEFLSKNESSYSPRLKKFIAEHK